MAMKIVTGILLCLIVLPFQTFGACREESFAGGLLPRAHAASVDATLRYFGHNFFQIISARGTKIVTDPLAPGWYPLTIVPGDVVTIGREHENHNWTAIVSGNPMILRGLIETESGYEWNKIRTNVKDVLVYNVPVYNKLPDDGGLYKGAAFVFDLGRIGLGT